MIFIKILEWIWVSIYIIIYMRDLYILHDVLMYKFWSDFYKNDFYNNRGI